MSKVRMTIRIGEYVRCRSCGKWCVNCEELTPLTRLLRLTLQGAKPIEDGRFYS